MVLVLVFVVVDDGCVDVFPCVEPHPLGGAIFAVCGRELFYFVCSPVLVFDRTSGPLNERAIEQCQAAVGLVFRPYSGR